MNQGHSVRRATSTAYTSDLITLAAHHRMSLRRGTALLCPYNIVHIDKSFMKAANPTIRLLAYGLCLATLLYNCKPKNRHSLTLFAATGTSSAIGAVLAGFSNSSTPGSAVTQTATDDLGYAFNLLAPLSTTAIVTDQPGAPFLTTCSEVRVDRYVIRNNFSRPVSGGSNSSGKSMTGSTFVL